MRTLHPIVQDMQATYPNPGTSDEDDGGDDGYCIGGAVLRYVQGNRPTGMRLAFPTPFHIASALRKLNSHLAMYTARRFAGHIIAANDDGKFWLAGRYLSDALQAEPKVGVIKRDCTTQEDH